MEVPWCPSLRGSSMPSIPSQLFNPITNRAVESLFRDFDVERARSLLARVDGLNPSPSGVSIDPVELAHCGAEWIRTGRRTDRVVLYLPGGGWVLRWLRGGAHVEGVCVVASAGGGVGVSEGRSG